MRGKQRVRSISGKTSRITPADAGKTVSNDAETGIYRDHPRGCGENQLHVHAITDDVGSPPRMRGKLMPKKVH